jgi:hypothetical protein
MAISQRAEPTYSGKTVNQWLDAGYEDALMALHEIGPPALPYVLSKLAREDPRYGSLAIYGKFWKRTPALLRQLVSKPRPTNFDETRAYGALMELGPRIIPLLSSELQCRNPAVREVSAHVLGAFCQRHKDIQRAVPVLTKALQDPNGDVRKRAAWALNLKVFPAYE